MHRDPRTPVSVTTVHSKGRAFIVRIYDQRAYEQAIEESSAAFARSGHQDTRPERPLTRNTPYPKKKALARYQWTPRYQDSA